MDADSIYELQKIDCNCNNCGYFFRSISKTNQLNTNEHIRSCIIHYGFCEKFKKEVGEIANICLLHTQACFIHRKDNN